MELNPTQLAAQSADLKSLELLFDYTTFHIGLYLTLASAYIAVASLKIGENLAVKLDWNFVIGAMIGFMLAGLAGGVIVSSITQCFSATAADCRSTATFLDRDIGPLGLTFLWFKAKYWIYIEHSAFWAGLVFALLSFIRGHK